MQPATVTADFADQPLPEMPADPAAPYGINPDTGRPYRQSPEERAAFGERMRVARDAARASGRSAGPKPAGRRRAARPSRAGRPAPAKTAPPELTYAQAAAGVLQIPAFALAVAGRFVPTLALDSIALSRHTPQIAEQVGQIAVEDSRVAAALDRAAQVGPWGGLVMAILPLGLQIAANHGWIQPSVELGILTPDELVFTSAPEEARE